MGPIHPRAKKPVGMRLAKVAMPVAYKAKGFSNGPTVSGCKATAASITVSFTSPAPNNGADAIKIQPYYMGDKVVKNKPYLKLGSMMEVLVNKSGFCMQQEGCPKVLTH